MLVNCNLYVEGFDCWQVGCITLARPTKSSSMFTQMVGRGLRLQDGTGNLLEATKAGMLLEKRDCRIIDVVDCSRRCNLVTLPSLMGLNADFDLHGTSITKAAEEIEKIQEKNPGIDFSNLTDLSKIKAYVESFDLLADICPTEVREISQLGWTQAQDGAYVLIIPEARDVVEARKFWAYRHEKLIVTQNELDEYILNHAEVGKERQLGIYNTLQEALNAADDCIRRCRPDRLKVLQREAAWHANAATDASKKYLRRLVGKKSFNFCTCAYGPKCSGVPGTPCMSCGKIQLNAGQVTTAINKLRIK